METIAFAIVIGALVELRVAVHRFGQRVSNIETEQSRMRALHVLPVMAALCVMLLLGGCDRPLALAGSGVDSGTGAIGNSAGHTIAGMGHAFLWLGGFAVVGGLVARLAVGTHAGLAVAEAGFVVLVTGASFVWIGHNTWTLAASVAGTLCAWLWYRWPYALRLLRHRQTQIQAA